MSEKAEHEKKEKEGCFGWLFKIFRLIGAYVLGLIVFWGIYNFFPGTREQATPWAAIASTGIALLISRFKLPNLKIDNEGLKTFARPWRFVSPHIWVVAVAYFVLAISIPACAGVTYFATRETLVTVLMGTCGLFLYIVPLVVIYFSWKAHSKLPKVVAPPTVPPVEAQTPPQTAPIHPVTEDNH